MPAPRRRTQNAIDFQRHEDVAGWVYIARNDELREHTYKIGYTTRDPAARIQSLNTEQRNRTSQIGFFVLVHSVRVMNSYGAEQLAFAKLEKYRITPRKEFFNAPLQVLVDAIEQAASDINNKVQAFRKCLSCDLVMQFIPLPNVVHACPHCGQMFTSSVTGDIFEWFG